MKERNDNGIENYKIEADKYYIKVNQISDDQLKNLWGFIAQLDLDIQERHKDPEGQISGS